MKLLKFPHKMIRAKVIKGYLKDTGYKKVVCFSCGNNIKALRAEGLEVLYVGENGDLSPNKWYTQGEIRKVFPEYFDATSGHLPMELMLTLGEAYKTYLGELEDEIVYVPSGSGETLVCLKMAYPDKKFVAVYNLDKATEYDRHCVLNRLVELLAADIQGVENGEDNISL